MVIGVFEYRRIAGKRDNDSPWEWISPIIPVCYGGYFTAMEIMEGCVLNNISEFGKRQIVVIAPNKDAFDKINWDEFENPNSSLT